MKQFTIYSNPSNQYKAVKIGWSWPGFLFGVVWAFTKKLWAVGGITIGAFVVLAIIISGLDPDVSGALSNLASLVMSVIFGIKGNELVCSNLESKGYTKQTVISADNNDAAIAFYITKEKQKDTKKDTEKEKD